MNNDNQPNRDTKATAHEFAQFVAELMYRNPGDASRHIREFCNTVLEDMTADPHLLLHSHAADLVLQIEAALRNWRDR